MKPFLFKNVPEIQKKKKNHKSSYLHFQKFRPINVYCNRRNAGPLAYIRKGSNLKGVITKNKKDKIKLFYWLSAGTCVWALVLHKCLNTYIINPVSTKMYLSDLKNQFVRRRKHSGSVIKTDNLLLYREIIAVCSKIHTKHVNSLCGQNTEFINFKPDGS